MELVAQNDLHGIELFPLTPKSNAKLRSLEKSNFVAMLVKLTPLSVFVVVFGWIVLIRGFISKRGAPRCTLFSKWRWKSNRLSEFLFTVF